MEKHHVDDVRERFSFHVVEETRDAAFVERRRRVDVVASFSRALSRCRRKKAAAPEEEEEEEIVSLVSASDDRESVRNSYSDA